MLSNKQSVRYRFRTLPTQCLFGFWGLRYTHNPIVEAILVPNVHMICCILNSVCVFVWWRRPVGLQGLEKCSAWTRWFRNLC